MNDKRHRPRGGSRGGHNRVTGRGQWRPQEGANQALEGFERKLAAHRPPAVPETSLGLRDCPATGGRPIERICQLYLSYLPGKIDPGVCPKGECAYRTCRERGII